MNTLFLIPARGGSKGIPKKNIKHLGGRPLIYYAIDGACKVANPSDICVSTDSDEIIEVVESYPLTIPFKRPSHLATDHSGSYEVLRHAIDFYEHKGLFYDVLVLLQPTSPFRRGHHIQAALALYTPDIDMVVSVVQPSGNPYFNLFESDANGYLSLSKKSDYTRRQDAPSVYEYNGAIYVINVNSLKQYNSLGAFPKIKKFEMDSLSSVDLDVPMDWTYAEFLLEKGYVVNMADSKLG